MSSEDNPPGLSDEAYLFTVTLNDGSVWHIYRMEFGGKKGQMAFSRKGDGQWMLGMFKEGNMNAAKMQKYLQEHGRISTH